MLTSLDFTKIPEIDLIFLIREVVNRKALSLDIPKGIYQFSKPKNFFMKNRSDFLYLRNGKIIPNKAIENLNDNEYFIAYKIRNNKISLYGYFPERNCLNPEF